MTQELNIEKEPASQYLRKESFRQRDGKCKGTEVEARKVYCRDGEKSSGLQYGECKREQPETDLIGFCSSW